MLTKEQLEARRKGLGGSDTATILNLNKYCTPLELYMRKRGELPDETDSLRLELGNFLEPLIQKKYEEYTGNVVINTDKTDYHPKYPFMLGNYDGYINDKYLVEFKTCDKYDISEWGEASTDLVPQYYATQVHHYMTIKNAEKCDLAVLFGFGELRIYTIYADHEISQFLIEKETEFWDMVQSGTPPPLSTIKDWELQHFKFAKKQNIECIPIKNSLFKLKQIQTQIKELEQQATNLKVGIMEFMGENKELTLNDKKVGGIITKSLTGWDFDALKADKEIKEKYMTKTINSAYFQLSARKDLNDILLGD